MSNVRLAIRVRPFTDKELKSEKDRVRVVNVVDSNTVTITNLKVSASGAGDSRERVRRYQADYTFDSACPPTQLSYASQDRVFQTIGREVLSSISRGCSACVLAYGQSATGKTHTMMGTDAQPGLVPRICRALADMVPFDVTVSFLEIYNERVHDLLVGEALPVCHSLPRRKGNARKDLRVREHPTKGPYVQNLRRVSVQNVEALLSLVREGTRRRHTAATRRNTTSSRSHALLELSTPRATLHLADLAGSEKASWDGCGGGGRQKEGANINKSLVALSNVISALVTNGTGKTKFVPYRDSALTWLLKDCFTGGASTFIIATLSPSVACYGESASTLRWAARARQLPTTSPLVNGTLVISKADLQVQLDLLIAELANDHIRYVPETGKIIYDDNHWTLQNKHIEAVEVNTETKIGSYLSIMHRKSEPRSAESSSSLALSDSSDFINAEDKNKITSEIKKEVDKILGSTLERTSSGCDLKVVPPLRHKRREYRSQEVLHIPATTAEVQNATHIVNSQSELQINTVNQQPEAIKASHVPIYHENQRSEIVAAVTDRLYSKLKKKEEAVVSKMESIVDKKIVEPLGELRICTNARQRLIELSHKAIRNKRRIGIPAHTQTKVSVIRVKDQAVDIQTDLDAYYVVKVNSHGSCRDVATETISMTPRCKEKSVGPEFGSLRYRDISTVTEFQKVVLKDSYTSTDICGKCDCSTQTQVIPPPRRKKRCPHLPGATNNDTIDLDDVTVSPVISINISQTYPVDSDSQSSDENSTNTKDKKVNPITPTPDLLANHTAETTEITESLRNGDTYTNNAQVNGKLFYPSLQGSDTSETQNGIYDFSDSDDHELPRVKVGSMCENKNLDMKNLILGRNKNMFPYNIVLSPEKKKDYCKRTVSFKDFDIEQAMKMASKIDQSGHEDVDNKSNSTLDESFDPDFDNIVQNECGPLSDSTGSSKTETDSFVWKRNNERSKSLSRTRREYVPVYKPSKYNTSKARLCTDFLCLENEKTTGYFGNTPTQNTQEYNVLKDTFEDYNNFEQRSNTIENKLNCREKYDFLSIEENILDSCKSLERTVNKYENYISNVEKAKMNCLKKGPLRTPTEYLQYLIQIRKNVIKSESEDTDSSLISRK